MPGGIRDDRVSSASPKVLLKIARELVKYPKIVRELVKYPKIVRELVKYPKIARELVKYPKIVREFVRYPQYWKEICLLGSDKQSSFKCFLKNSLVNRYHQNGQDPHIFLFLSFFPSPISGVSLLCQKLGFSIFHSFSYCLSCSANVISFTAI